jgi:hypothetical protein
VSLARLQLKENLIELRVVQQLGKQVLGQHAILGTPDLKALTVRTGSVNLFRNFRGSASGFAG